ncbi:hypothetical protein SprV_0401572200 [Sparganum proliferum]
MSGGNQSVKDNVLVGLDVPPNQGLGETWSRHSTGDPIVVATPSRLPQTIQMTGLPRRYQQRCQISLTVPVADPAGLTPSGTMTSSALRRISFKRSGKSMRVLSSRDIDFLVCSVTSETRLPTFHQRVAHLNIVSHIQ